MSDNDLFRFVSLRGPLDGITINPSGDMPDLQTVRLTQRRCRGSRSPITRSRRRIVNVALI